MALEIRVYPKSRTKHLGLYTPEHSEYRKRYPVNPERENRSTSTARTNVAKDLITEYLLRNIPIVCSFSGLSSADIARRYLDGSIPEIRARAQEIIDKNLLKLEVDHINGDPTDHRFENLRWLSTEAHALTSTYKKRS